MLTSPFSGIQLVDLGESSHTTWLSFYRQWNAVMNTWTWNGSLKVPIFFGSEYGQQKISANLCFSKCRVVLTVVTHRCFCSLYIAFFLIIFHECVPTPMPAHCKCSFRGPPLPITGRWNPDLTLSIGGRWHLLGISVYTLCSSSALQIQARAMHPSINSIPTVTNVM